MLKDEIAESLEAKGLYRRASARWSEVMHLCVNDIERSEARRRRDLCVKLLKKTPPEPENFSGLHRAACETQRRMGITEPRGIRFSLKDYYKVK
ncbi:PerC family transcriptional regulator [Enterobacter cloacae]|uniref:PerC family transcriptional regulator n=1 Tax=Enterobacter cloacae TaxID=550 RepID=UPI002FF4AFCE